MAANLNGAVVLREYVSRALTNKAKGVDATSYNNLVKELSSLRKTACDKNSLEAAAQMLANMIHAIKDCTSVLREGKHDKLLNEVLGINLWNCMQIVRVSVLDLIGNLVVSNVAFTHTCLQLLVYSFLPPPSPPVPDEDIGAWVISDDAAIVQAAVLSTLEKVLEMVPTAPAKLLQLVIQGMPHKLRDRNTQCLYVSAVLGLAERRGGAPVRDGLLAATVEHLLSIDVEIKWEDIVDVPTGQEAEEEGPSDESDEHEDIFELEGMVDLGISGVGDPEEEARRREQIAMDRGGWEGAAAGVKAKSQAAAASTSGRPAVDETANKMDSLMELLLSHVAKRQEGDDAKELWPCLLAIFERCIVSTHRSKFTQFLVFYMCSRQPPALCAASFIELLIARLRDARQPPITRSASVAYLASFLARAAFVPQAQVLSALEGLVSFCKEYATDVSARQAAGGSGSEASPRGGMGGGGGGFASPAAALQHSSSSGQLSRTHSLAGLEVAAQQHQVYYASVQSVLYVLCYHMRGLMSSSAADGGRLAAATRQLVRGALLPLLAHRQLSPLAMCLTSVVAEFRHQAAALGLVELSALNSAVADGSRSTQQRPLEMFFPFDPYLLKRSSRHLHLRQSYVRWRHGHPSTHVAAAKGGSATGAAAAGGRSGAQGHEAHGDSDAGEDEDDSDEDDDDDDAGMDEEDEDGSSDDSDGLEGMSLPSDSILSRPNIPSTVIAQQQMVARQTRPPKHPARSHAMGGVTGGAGRNHHHPFEPQRYSGDDMAVSYHSPSSLGMGDVMGTSPLLVQYMSPGQCGSGESPMQMTPVFSSLEHSRLRRG